MPDRYVHCDSGDCVNAAHITRWFVSTGVVDGERAYVKVNVLGLASPVTVSAHSYEDDAIAEKARLVAVLEGLDPDAEEARSKGIPPYLAHRM